MHSLQFSPKRAGTDSVSFSHQYIDQLSLPVRQAVFGNVGTVITFRIGYADAEIMEKEFGKTFPPSALADLGRFEVALKLLDHGTNKEPFRAKTHPPLESPMNRKDVRIAQSRMRYAVRRSKIDEKLNRWMARAGMVSPPN